MYYPIAFYVFKRKKVNFVCYIRTESAYNYDARTKCTKTAELGVRMRYCRITVLPSQRFRIYFRRP